MSLAFVAARSHRAVFPSHSAQNANMVILSNAPVLSLPKERISSFSRSVIEREIPRFARNDKYAAQDAHSGIFS